MQNTRILESKNPKTAKESRVASVMSCFEAEFLLIFRNKVLSLADFEPLN